MKRKSLAWLLLFAVVAAAAGGYYLLRDPGGAAAYVYVDGELYGVYDLKAAVIPYEVRVETEYGWNTLRVSHGAIQVAAADCKGRDCVRQGAIHDGLIPIVCLPHHLVIQIEE